MAGSTVSASIVVQFGDVDSSDYSVSIEVDGRSNGLNSGNTSFSAGDTVFLLLHKSANVSIISSTSSAGSLVKQAGIEAVVIQDEYVIFTDEDEATVSKPISSSFTYEWVGNSLGSLVVSGHSKVKASNKGVAVAKVSYVSDAIVYKLNTPTDINGSVDYQILCVVFVGVN